LDKNNVQLVQWDMNANPLVPLQIYQENVELDGTAPLQTEVIALPVTLVICANQVVLLILQLKLNVLQELIVMPPLRVIKLLHQQLFHVNQVNSVAQKV
jgi:hypothetical protein